MFCEKCGAKLQETDEFCTNCGAKISNGNKVIEKNIEDKEIQLRVKPTFKFVYMMFPALVFYPIVILLIAVIFYIVSPNVGINIGISLFVIYAVILVISTIVNKKQYDNRIYDFYKTKVVYGDNFLNISEKEVKYKHIREATMRQTFMQRYFNIGDIILFTNAETGFANGIYIKNVANVQEIYKKIKSIIDR